MKTLENLSIADLESSWRDLLADDDLEKQFKDIKTEILEEIKNYPKHRIFPPANLFFNAMNLCPVSKVKVVIVGQDPYPVEEQAHGLAFSVPFEIEEKDIPDSLLNIYEELEHNDLDFKFKRPNHGNLMSWAEQQGVLLLNSALSVREKLPKEKPPKSPHLYIWKKFTDSIIEELSRKKENLVFMLWGRDAQEKEDKIEQPDNHCVLKASHPSPKSAEKELIASKKLIGCEAFIECKHFSKANEFLKEHGLEPIDWRLNPKL